MKRLFVILAVGLFLMAAAPMTSVADQPTSVWMETAAGVWGTEWTASDPLALARLTRVGVMIDSACNKKYWDIEVDIHASVGQWVKWSLSFQGWEWKIKKPGCYAGNCIEFQISSNGDIFIDYKDFADLHSVSGSTHNEDIETYYSFGESITDAETKGWVRAVDLNYDDDRLVEQDLVDPYNLHEGITYKLWSKVCVVECNTACEYHDDAMITLVLEQQKPWLDDLGNWR